MTKENRCLFAEDVLMNSVLLALVGLASTTVASPPAETVRVAICQMRVEDGRISENLEQTEAFVRKAKDAGAEICVFPELIDVGFGPIVKSKSQAQLAAPIPGRTADRLAMIAVKYDVWIVTALLEEVPGGAYDCGVIIDNRGSVVAKHRKGFCYPSFAGTPCFPGNHQDPWLVESPWGPLGVLTCADIRQASNRQLLAGERPSAVFVSFANPQADLAPLCGTLATECGCPVVGANMIFGAGPGLLGGKSRFVSADGALLWQGGETEVVQTWDLTVRSPNNRPPWLTAGDVQTIRLPERRVALRGQVLDDGRPRGVVKTRWSMKTGPGSVDFAEVHAPATVASFSAPGTYVLCLTADDGDLARSDYTSVNVLALDGSDPDLIGYWTFDGSSRDQSGHENHASLHGQATYSDETAPTGHPNPHCLDLKSGAFALVPHSSSLDAPHAVTIALWVKFRSAPPMWPERSASWVAILAKGKWWQENYALGIGAYLQQAGQVPTGTSSLGRCPRGLRRCGSDRDGRGWRRPIAAFCRAYSQGRKENKDVEATHGCQLPG